MSSSFVTGLDIGTSSIKVAVAENKKGKPVVRALFKELSCGLRRGVIVELAEASQAISAALLRVKAISRAAANNIYVNIGTPQAKTQQSRGIVAVSRSDNEIYQDDIDKVVKASQAINLPPNRSIIHNITREFVVDGIGNIDDPLGLSGSRLEVNSLIVDAFSPHIKNLTRVVELAGGEIGGLVFSPLAASRSALSRAQKELGVVLVDIGFGTTGMSVYEEGRLVSVAKFPIGASDISNDLAIVLKIQVGVAESLKLDAGYVFSEDISIREQVDLRKFFPEARSVVSRRHIAKIAEVRMEEILELINGELKLVGKYADLPGGAVFVGGGAKIPGLTDLARQELKLSSQIGIPVNGTVDIGGDLSDLLQDPEYAMVLGLVFCGMDGSGWGKRRPARFDIRSALKYFLP